MPEIREVRGFRREANMASVQLSGVIPGVSGNAAAGLGVAAPTPGGSGGDGLALGRGQVKAAASAAKAASGGETPAAPEAKGQVTATVPRTEPALNPIGTQMVLVFDDQTHAMSIKMLDIETQKVMRPVLPEAESAATRALAGPSSSGTLVDTKA